MRLPPEAVLGVFCVLLLHEAVLFGRVFFERDVQLVWYGQVQSFVDAVASGAWPVWDPRVAFGHPMLANPNTQVLYPFTWLNLIVRQGPFYTLYALAHLLLAGVGAYRLACRLGLRAAAATTAALAWTGSGPLVSLVSVWHHLAGASLIPWVAVAAERLIGDPRPRRAAVCGLLLGLQVLAGSPDMSLMTSVLLATVVGLAVVRRARTSNGRRLLASAALAAVLALAVSAGQWIPTAELARGSVRAQLDPRVRTTWSVHPLALPELLTPVAWTELPISDRARQVLFDGGHPFLRSLYLGVVTLALAMAGALGRSPWRGTVLVVGALALLFAMGSSTPFYGVVTFLVPPLKLMRFPSKAMVWVALSSSLLAGMGVDALMRLRARRAAIVSCALATTGLAVAAVLVGRFATTLGGVMVPPALLGMPLAVALRPAAIALAVAAALGAATVALIRLAPLGPAAATAVGVLVALDLLAAHSRLNKTVPAEFYRYRPPVMDVVARQRLPRLFIYRYSMSGADVPPALAGRNPYRVARYPANLGFDGGRALAARLYPLPPANAAFGLSGSFDPDLLGLYPPPLQELVSLHEQVEGTPGWVRLLQMGAVTHVVALHDPAPGALVPTAVFDSFLAERIRVFSVPDPLPRASVAAAFREASGRAADELILDPGFDPRREVVLAAVPAGLQTSGGGGTARVEDYRADRVRVTVAAPAGGFLVLADTWAPGWKAAVDGRPAPVLRANVAFRAIPVAPGTHTVDMRYRPASVLAGLLVSLCGVTAAAALLLVPRRPARPRPAAGRP